MTRRFPNLAAALLPALLLAACGDAGPPPEPPLSPQALAAVSENPGAQREKLARAVDQLFTAEGIGETRAVLVMHGGEIAAERYAEGYGEQTPFLGWSYRARATPWLAAAVAIGVVVHAYGIVVINVLDFVA